MKTRYKFYLVDENGRKRELIARSHDAAVIEAMKLLKVKINAVPHHELPRTLFPNEGEKR